MSTKKYVSLDKLSLYDEKLKAKMATDDAAALASAKEYADGLATNYDASGSAATAKAEANAYTDTQIGSVNEVAAGIKTTAETALANAATADGKAVEAKAAADKAQGEVDALEAYVGTFTSDDTNVKTVVDYIDAKTSGIATDAALSELQGKVAQAETDIDALEAKVGTETVAKQISDAVKVETDRATGIESGLRTDVDAIKADYLKASDKESLQTQITTNANAIEALTNGTSAEEIDSVMDLIAYVNEHGTEVQGMKDSINVNAGAISTEETRAKGVESDLDTAVKAAQADATKANKDLATEIERATGVEGDLGDRITALEGAIGESGSVADDIAAAKQEAIDTAASDATAKANTAESNAKGYADSLNTAMNNRVEALEAIDHDHANKAELDLIAAGDKAKWDTAAGKAHEHANKTVLDGIDVTKVSAWDAAESNAKTYADGLNTAMGARVTTLENWHNNFTEASEEDINNLFGLA